MPKKKRARKTAGRKPTVKKKRAVRGRTTKAKHGKRVVRSKAHRGGKRRVAKRGTRNPSPLKRTVVSPRIEIRTVNGVDGEYEVRTYLDKKKVERLTYFTNDRSDALGTHVAIAAEAVTKTPMIEAYAVKAKGGKKKRRKRARR